MRAILWCESNLFNVIPGEKGGKKKSVTVPIDTKYYNSRKLQPLDRWLRASSNQQLRSKVLQIQVMRACHCPTHHTRTEPNAETPQTKRTASIQKKRSIYGDVMYLHMICIIIWKRERDHQNLTSNTTLWWKFSLCPPKYYKIHTRLLSNLEYYIRTVSINQLSRVTCPKWKTYILRREFKC